MRDGHAPRLPPQEFPTIVELLTPAPRISAADRMRLLISDQARHTDFGCSRVDPLCLHLDIRPPRHGGPPRRERQPLRASGREEALEDYGPVGTPSSPAPSPSAPYEPSVQGDAEGHMRRVLGLAREREMPGERWRTLRPTNDFREPGKTCPADASKCGGSSEEQPSGEHAPHHRRELP